MSCGEDQALHCQVGDLSLIAQLEEEGLGRKEE